MSLGDLIDGTPNFSANSVKFRSMLGYRDTMRTLKYRRILGKLGIDE